MIVNKVKDFFGEINEKFQDFGGWKMIILFVFLGVIIFWIPDWGKSDYEEEEPIWPGLVVLAIFVIGIYTYKKLSQLRRLEDIIRYLNDKYKLYHKEETYTFLSGYKAHVDISLKPRNMDEQESYPGSTTFQSDYSEAVLSSRWRLRKQLKKRQQS